MIQLLLVEDDERLNRLYKVVLEGANYQVFSAFDGEQALDILDEQHIDMIITDIMMPNMNGYEFVELVRASNYTQPVLMISAKDQYEDLEKGYDLGIDDYMVKPIDVNEMLLRVRAILKRVKLQSEKTIVIGDIVLDQDALTLTISGNETLLPQKEFLLLVKLIGHPNKIFTRQQLMDEIWGYEVDSDERTVDVHINRLRRRLEHCESLEIITVRGLGYKVIYNEK